MGGLYKINPLCPHCGEEHEYWTIRCSKDSLDRDIYHGIYYL